MLIQEQKDCTNSMTMNTLVASNRKWQQNSCSMHNNANLKIPQITKSKQPLFWQSCSSFIYTFCSPHIFSGLSNNNDVIGCNGISQSYHTYDWFIPHTCTTYPYHIHITHTTLAYTMTGISQSYHHLHPNFTLYI